MTARAQARIALFAGAAVLGAADAARAEPLSKETCDTLKFEQETIVAAGVKDDMAKGPEWAKAHLSRDKLGQIRRWIELEEQLSFRCGLAKVRITLPPDEEATGQGPDGQAQPAQPAAAQPAAAPADPPAAKPKPKPKPAAKPAAEQPAAAASPPAAAQPSAPTTPKAAAPTAETPKAAPKPKPKPKADDAFRPPAGPNPDADPFARQLAPKG